MLMAAIATPIDFSFTEIESPCLIYCPTVLFEIGETEFRVLNNIAIGLAREVYVSAADDNCEAVFLMEEALQPRFYII